MSTLNKARGLLNWAGKHKTGLTTGVAFILLAPFSGIAAGIAVGIGATVAVGKHVALKRRAKQLNCRSVAEYKQKYLK